MDKDDFVKLQFETLRKEIEESKDRLFRIMTSGVVIIPVGQFLAQLEFGKGAELALGILMLLLPFVVVAFMLLFLAESNTIMRAGRYIRKRIEPLVNEFEGWETWLEKGEGCVHRSCDRTLKGSFLFLYIVYYITSAALAINFLATAEETVISPSYIGSSLAASLGVVYLAIGIVSIIFVVANTRTSTA